MFFILYSYIFCVPFSTMIWGLNSVTFVFQGKGGRRITKVRLGEYQVAGEYNQMSFLSESLQSVLSGSFTDNLHGLPKEQEFTIARDAVFVHEQYK